MMTAESISILFSFASLLIAIGSIITSVLAFRQSRNSAIQTILFELLNHYNSPEMNSALSYMGKLRRENSAEFEENPYSFARRYVENTPQDSKEYNYRRRVSHFLSYLASLMKNRIVDENLLFSLIDPNQLLSQIEFLEPIEVAISEKYFNLPQKEWDILWLRSRCVKYIKKHKGRLSIELVPPLNKDKYSQSLEKPHKKERTRGKMLPTD